MARTKRICPAGEVFHVLNRAVARLTIFEKPEDYAAFMRVVEETWEIVPLPIYAMVENAESLAFGGPSRVQRSGERVFSSPHRDAHDVLACTLQGQ